MIHWKPNFLAGVSLAVLFACAFGPDRPLSLRGLPIEKRHDFILENGLDAPLEIRNAFMDGFAIRGMAVEWVLQLYGRPDRSFERSWEYFDKKGNLVAGIVFKGNKVDSVYGDPNEDSRAHQ